MMTSLMDFRGLLMSTMQLLIGKDGLVRGVVVRIISEKDQVTELQ